MTVTEEWGTVAHTSIPSAWEVETGGPHVQDLPWLRSRIWSQPGLHVTLSQNNNSATKIYKVFSDIFQVGCWHRSPFLVLSLLLPRCHEMKNLFLPVLPIMMLCVTMGPKSTGSSDHGVKLLRLWTKSKPFFLITRLFHTHRHSDKVS